MTPQVPVNAPPIFNATIAALGTDFENYRRTGIYDADTISRSDAYFYNNANRDKAVKTYKQQLRETPLLHEGPTRRFFRQCAREMGRPFVFTRKWHTYKSEGGMWVPNGVGRYFYFPKQLRLEPLYASLLLLARSNQGRGYTHNQNLVTHYKPGYRIIEFWVTEQDGGVDLYQHMVERIRTNPTFRSIFKIPEEV